MYLKIRFRKLDFFFKDLSGNVNARLLGVDYFITNGQI